MSSFSQPKCKSPSIHNLNNEIKKINIDILKNNNSHNIKTQNAISNMLDVINDNNLNLFYKDGTSKFKYNIDQLNLKFYLETEKILSSTQSDLSHNQNRLFLILFKQITLYIKEIERLNLVLIEESKNPSYLKKKVSFIEKQKLEFETKENLIQSLKNSISLLDAIISENQIREESEKLKKEVKYYKQLYQQCIGISPKKTIDNDSKRKSKRTYSDNNQSGSLYNGNVNINNSQNKTEINLYDKSLYNKSTSKLKIIKTVKNKISYSNNSKKSFNNQNINNFNNTQKDNSNLNIYNCNSNSNSASNHSSNNIIDDNNNINNKNKTPKSGFNSNKISHKNISIKRENITNKELRELNKLENLLLDIKNYIKNENSYLNIHSVKFFNNNNNKTRNLNENMFFNKKNITDNNSSINPRFINPKKKLSSNGALDNKIM